MIIDSEIAIIISYLDNVLIYILILIVNNIFDWKAILLFFAYIWTMEKVVNIITLKQKQSDYQFWLTKSFNDRLDAIELLRAQYIKFRKDVQPRLQRVCRVINKI